MEFRRSFRLSKSEHILLSSESVSSECAKIAGYERLTQSMRLNEEYDYEEHKKNKRGVGFLTKVLNFTRISTPQEATETATTAAAKKEKKRKRTSWLPDPDKRWPIQVW
jgi:hypothetical protein